MIRYVIPVLAIACSALPAIADEATSCGEPLKLGTAIYWQSSIKEAAKLAKEEDKLLLVLHVSGHFPDPALT